jgi:hypothetical protein
VGRAAILKQDEVPAAPVRAHPFQKVLVGQFIPHLGDQQEHLPRQDVDRAMEDAFGPLAGNGHAHLLADVAIAAVEGRRLGDDGFIEHEQDRALMAPEALFKPPFACRQKGSRRPSSCRGCFQRNRKRASTRPMLRRLTLARCCSHKCCWSKAAVQTVEL